MSRSQIRDVLFPIYGKYEVTKFLLLGMMKFFIIFILTLTRDTKDTLVVTTCGAEAIAFLKVYGVLPAAATFIVIYSRMAFALPRKPLFYTTSIPFFLFFILFDLIIYPNANILEPSIDIVNSWFGSGNKDQDKGGSEVVAKILSHWTSALYFVVAEVYSSVSVGILFWKFANDVVSVSQAKRFYSMFAYISSLAPIFAGQFVARYATNAASFAISLRRLTVVIFLSAIMICLLHHIINEFVERNKDAENDDLDSENSRNGKSGIAAPTNGKLKRESSIGPMNGIPKRRLSVDSSSTKEEKSTEKIQKKPSSTSKPKKRKLSMVDSLKFLASSEYLGLMTVLVVGYGLMYNFLEVSWKSLVKEQYPDKLEYQRFMGNFSSLVGTATLVVIFLGSNIIKKLGWRIGALATPVIMSLLAIPFFTCTAFIGVENNPPILNAAVAVGSLMILLSRAFKYGLFDPTTQMAYIPLDEESKVKGKAAIDVLGSRLGKSGASFVQQGLVFVFGNIIEAAPVVLLIFYTTSIFWIRAANKLSVLYLSRTTSKDK